MHIGSVAVELHIFSFLHPRKERSVDGGYEAKWSRFEYSIV